MSDKIPYSNVTAKNKPAATSKVRSSNIKAKSNSGAGKGDKARHDLSVYADNYDDIKWD
tara:strand:- start:647 stop:823 length:177 start_codon:yes stop_codon:yes gene_type:complete